MRLDQGVHKGSIHRVCGRHKRFPVIPGVLVYLRLMYIRIHPYGDSEAVSARFPVSRFPTVARVRIARTVRKRTMRARFIGSANQCDACPDRLEAHSACAYMLQWCASAMFFGIITDVSADDSPRCLFSFISIYVTCVVLLVYFFKHSYLREVYSF